MKTTLASLLTLSLSLGASAQSFDPPTAVDVNPDPTIVEVNISANVTTWQYIPGVDTTVWAYSDDSPGGVGASVPGPTIRANVGDTLRVHFTNNLPEATTIHWHGIENYADQDGSHISQLHVPPGGTFDYEFPLLSEGLYWYHPHVRTFDQVEKGLHAALLVKDPAKEAQVFTNLGGRAVEEHIVFFDDVLLDANDQVVPAFSFTDPLQNALYHLNGRVGNVLLVNGREASTVTLPVTNGAIQNWYIVNAANTTICRLEVTRHPTQGGPGVPGDTWEIGSDGGYVQFPYKRLPMWSTQPTTEHIGQSLVIEQFSGVLLFPGERMQIAFTPIGSDGETFTIQQWDWFRGRHLAVWNPTMTQIMLPDDPLDGGYPTLPYFDVQLQGNDPGLGQWTPNFLFPFPPLAPPYGLQLPSIPVTFGHGLPDPATGAVTLFAQSTVGDDGGLVPLPSMKIGSFEAHDINMGDVRKWEVTNLTHGDHPFHVHGFFFELIEYQWVDMLNPAANFKYSVLANNISSNAPNPAFPFVPPRKRKDTIRVPARLGAKGSSKTFARLRVHFDDTGRQGRAFAEGEIPTIDKDGNVTAGGWLFHCHVLEHSGKGMLSFFELRDPSTPFRLLGKHKPGSTTPYLTGSGTLATGINLDLVNAAPNTQVFLIHSNQLGNNSLFGGTLVPLLNQPSFNKVTDAQGRATWSSGPGQPQRYWQAIYWESGIQAWAMSNALEIR